MIEIIPAVLPRSREDVEEIVARYIDSPIQTIQIDLVDGNFASPKTWPYNSKHQYDEYKKIQEEGFPGWQDIDIELDLMIENPIEALEKFIEWGPSRIIVHASSVDQKEYTAFLEKHKTVQSFIHFGIAFGVDDVISDYENILSHVDFVQCMGIATIGKQSQIFDERVIGQIQTVASLVPHVPISVDGGVTPETAPRLIEAGASRLVSGSYMSKNLDTKEAVRALTGEEIE